MTAMARIESKLIQVEVLLASIREALRINAGDATTDGIIFIQNYVAQSFRIPHRDLVGSLRCGNIVWPRFIALEICRILEPCSLQMLAERFKYKSIHSVTHAHRTMRDRLEVDAGFRREFEVLMGKVREAMLQVEQKI